MFSRYRLLDDGDSVLFRISLAFLELLEPRLFIRERDELVSVLQGTNKGVLRVWRRELDGTSDDTKNLFLIDSMRKIHGGKI